jgi:hypothetical protein
MRRNWLFAGLGLVATLVVFRGCATTPTPIPGPIVDPAKWEPVEAGTDPTYKDIQRDYKGAALGANAQLDTTRSRMLAALKQPLTAGVTITDNTAQCGLGFGCTTDVTYDSPAAFMLHEKNVRNSPNSLLQQYEYATGRTGLLKQGNKYVVAWFFASPMPPEQDGTMNTPAEPGKTKARYIQKSKKRQPAKVTP